MGARSMRFVRGVCFAALAAGCTSLPPTVGRSPLEQPEAPPAIAVIAAMEPPAAGLTTPAYAEVVPGGAVVGGLGGALLGIELAQVAVMAAGFAAAPLLVPIIAGSAAVGVIGGAVAGAWTVVPPEQAAAIERVAREVVAVRALQGTIAEAVVGDVIRWTPYRAVVIAAADVRREGGGIDHAVLRERGYAGTIELAITRAGFAGQGGSDPGLRMLLAVEASLVDTANALPTARRGLVYLSPAHAVSAWTRDDGALTRQEIERAWRTLAERVVDALVLQAPLEVGFDAPPPPYVCGLAPLLPKLEWDGGFVTAWRPGAGAVATLTPELAWSRTPDDTGTRGATDWSAVAAADMRYDLRIWEAFDAAPGPLVYERAGLERPVHTVETALAPGTVHFWSVRLRYVIGGRPRATRWSAANVPPFAPPVPLAGLLYYSRLENGVPQPVRCESKDMTPCGCLDFIPRQNFFRFRTP